MFNTPLPQGFMTEWNRMLDAADSGKPRVAHGIPTDPEGLAAAMDEDDPGARDGGPDLYARLIEQVGHERAARAWGDACRWSDANEAAKGHTELMAHVEAALTAAAAGDLTCRDRLLAAAQTGALIQGLWTEDSEDDWRRGIADLESMAERTGALTAAPEASWHFGADLKALQQRLSGLIEAY